MVDIRNCTQLTEGRKNSVVNSQMDKLDADLGVNLLKCCGLWGGKLFLDVNKGHFYRRHEHLHQSSFICADDEFFSDASPDKMKFMCVTLLGQPHDHPILPQETVEIATFRWALRLRILRCHTSETISQSIAKVASSWPRGLTLKAFAEVFADFHRVLLKYKLQAKDPVNSTFLEEFGEQTLDRFRHALYTLPFWNQSVSVEKEGSKPFLPFTPTHPKQPKVITEKVEVIETLQPICKDPCPKMNQQSLPKLETTQQQVLTELSKVTKISQAIREGPCPIIYQQSLLEFEETITKCGDIVKKVTEDGAKTKVEVELIMGVAQYIFHPSRLEDWLLYKQHEIDVVFTILNTKKKVTLINKLQLKEQLYTKQMEYFVILRIPPLDGWTKKTFARMARFVETSEEILDINNDLNTIVGDESQDVPWHVVEEKRVEVLDQVRQLVNHAERNQQLLDYVQYSIIFGKNDKKSGHWYNVYEDGELLRKKISRLPDPPTGFSIRPLVIWDSTQSENTAVRLEWQYEDIGYPGHFLIEYRIGNLNNWNQVRTNEFDGLSQLWMTFKYKRGIVMEFRVATETCIGCSQFSPILNTRHLENSVCNEAKISSVKANVTETLVYSKQKLIIDETLSRSNVKRPKLNIEILQLASPDF